MPSVDPSFGRIAGVAAESCLLVLLWFCPLALGGAPIWALWLAGPLAAATLILTCLKGSSERTRFYLPPLSWVFGLSALGCALQLIPLPHRSLDFLSPEAAELRDFALGPLGLTRSRPISLDPPATSRALSKSLIELAAFLSASNLAVSAQVRRRIYAAISWIGTALALLGLGHEIFGAHSLAGYFSFKDADPVFLTPFGDANHLAAFLGLSAMVSLGLAVRAYNPPRAWLWWLAYLITGVGVLLSLSRAGIAFFVAAQLLFILLLRRARRPRTAETQRGQSPLGRLLARAPWLWAASAFVAVISVAGFLAFDRLASKFGALTSEGRLNHPIFEFWPVVFRAAQHFSLAGMGRGAFESAFTRFQTAHPSVTLAYPENFVLQYWSEWGLPFAAILSLLAIVGFWKLLRNPKPSILEVAVLASTVGLVLHNLFDFNLELLPCAVALTVALGVTSSKPEKHKGTLRPVTALGLSVALVLVLAPVLVLGRFTLDSDESKLRMLYSNGASGAEVKRAALPIIDRHPADYYLYLTVAAAYSLDTPDSSLAFVNRALFLRPIDIESHFVAARALLRANRRNQALAEYRLAYVAGEGSTRSLDEAVPLSKGVEELKKLVPPEAGPLVQVALRAWSSLGPDVAEELLRRAIQDLGPRPDSMELFVQAGEFRRLRRDFTSALQFAEQAGQKSTDPRISILKARIFADQGRLEQGIGELQLAITLHPQNFHVMAELGRQLAAVHKPELAREVLARASPFAVWASERVLLLILEAESYEAEGQRMRAIELLQRAAQLDPQNKDPHYVMGRLYEELHRYDDAIRAVSDGLKVDELRSRATGPRQWLERLRRLKDQQEENSLLQELKANAHAKPVDG